MIKEIEIWARRQGLAQVLALLIIVASGLFVRMWDIGRYDYNPDFYWELGIASGTLIDTIYYNFTRFTHPTLGAIVDHLMMSISRNEVFLRLIPVLPGVGAIIVFFEIGRRYIGIHAAFFLALMSAFSYATVTISQSIRPYSLMMFMLGLAILNLVNYANSGSRKYLYWYFTFCLLAVFSTYIAALIIAAVAIYGAGEIIPQDGMTMTKAKMKRLAGWLVPHFLILLSITLFYILQKPYVYLQVVYPRLTPWDAAAYPVNMEVFLGRLVTISMYFTAASKTAALAFLALILAGFCLSFRKQRAIPAVAAIIFIMLAALVMHKTYPLGRDRYIFFLYPLLTLPAALAIQYAGGKLSVPFRGGKNVALALVVILAIGAAWSISGSNSYRTPNPEFPQSKQERQALIDNLLSMVGGNDVIITDNTIAYYFVYETGMDKVEKVADDIERVEYHGHYIYYNPFRQRFSFYNPQELGQFIASLNRIHPMQDQDKVWYVYPNFSWAMPLSQVPVGGGVFRDLKPYTSYLSGNRDAGVFYSISFANLRKYFAQHGFVL